MQRELTATPAAERPRGAAAYITPRPFGRGRGGLVLLLLFMPFFCVSSAKAQDGNFDKAALAWNLPWDADWVTAVSFVGPNRIAAGNNLGHILIWELPGGSGGAAPSPV